MKYQVSKFGRGRTLSGRQQEVKASDEVLKAYALYNATGFQYLRVSPRTVGIKEGGIYVVKVCDGISGVVV